MYFFLEVGHFYDIETSKSSTYFSIFGYFPQFVNRLDRTLKKTPQIVLQQLTILFLQTFI